MKKTLLTLLILIICITGSNSQTTFMPKVTIDSNTGNNPYAIDSGFIDNDSYVDILVGTDVDHTIIWYKNNTDGTFTKQSAITNTLVNIVSILLVDLNNDSNLDILAVGFGSYGGGDYGVGSSMVWFENDGNGNFGTEQLIYNSHTGLSGLFVGTIDSGSTADIGFTSYAESRVMWLSNDGVGNFSGPLTIDTTLNYPATINMKDIDSDGDLDAIVATGADNGADVVEIFRNDLVPGGSVAWTKDGTSVTTGKNYLTNATFEDLDGDANLDILITELNTTPGTGNFYWVEENGVGGYVETAFTTSIGNPSIAKHLDLDDDGDKDIILSSGATADVNDIVWFLNDGSGNYGSEVVIDNTQSQVYVYTIADFDNDNDLDIASCAFNQDHLNWFENEKYLSISDENINKFSIYPNPANNALNFKIPFTENFKVSVFDILGKKVLATSLKADKSLDISNLNNGIYILKFDDYNTNFKFVKQ